ncbi:DUF2069 domain-containing protein [Oleiphilus messinensis]|nr:DUF2069 domain-containing protein [Oleiphilus messinensis]
MTKTAENSMQTPSSALARKTSISHNTAIVSYIGLLVLLVLTSFDAEISLALVLSIKLVPLLIFIPGLLKKNFKAHIWLCFVILLYFTQYSVRAYLTQGDWEPVLMTLFSVTTFIGSMMYVRWGKQLEASLSPVQVPDS